VREQAVVYYKKADDGLAQIRTRNL